MKLFATLIDDTVVLRPTGKIYGGSDATMFHDVLRGFLEHGMTKYIVDYGKVEYFGSTGLGLLISAYTLVKNNEGSLMIANIASIKNQLEITRTTGIFPVVGLAIEDQCFEEISLIRDPKDFLRRQRIASHLVSFALRVDEGKARLLPVHSAGVYRIEDPDAFQQGPIIALPSSFADSTCMFFKAEIEEFEYLINKDGVREIELQRFLEAHPKFILSSDYDKLHSGITLHRTGGSLIPDFFLEPYWSKRTCDILELKLPSKRLIVGPGNRRGFSSSIMRAVYQLREYHDYFEDEENRDRLLQEHGISAYKPKLYLLIGRSRFIDPLTRSKAEADFMQLRLYTYDDILWRAKKRMLT